MTDPVDEIAKAIAEYRLADAVEMLSRLAITDPATARAVMIELGIAPRRDDTGH